MPSRHRLLLVPVLLVTACSGDPSTIELPPTATPTVPPAVIPTTAPTPTPSTAATSAAPSTTATSVVRAKAVDGDVDGDGKPDAVKATAERLTVTLSGSGRQVTAPVHADSPAPPEVLGSTDVDLDGFAEVFVKTVEGASTGFATPYRFDGKVLHELQLDGSPAVLGFGGSTQHGDGFRCAGGRIEVRKAEAQGQSYKVDTTTYRLTTTALVQVSRSTTTAGEGSAEVAAAYALDCGSVGEGG